MLSSWEIAVYFISTKSFILLEGRVRSRSLHIWSVRIGVINIYTIIYYCNYGLLWMSNLVHAFGNVENIEIILGRWAKVSSLGASFDPFFAKGAYIVQSIFDSSIWLHFSEISSIFICLKGFFVFTFIEIGCSYIKISPVRFWIKL